jgi:putative DNA primase/helicase
MRTVEAATGRWREILPRLGISPRYLRNRHGPCPVCGGKDRFRFDDRNGSGSFFCNQCGPGAGIMLLRRFRGWDYATACREIDAVVGTAPPAAPARRAQAPKKNEAALRAALDRVLAEARTPGLVQAYLEGRGLHIVPAILRGHRRLAYLDDGRFMGLFPAMVAPVIGPDDSLQSVHRTYLADLPTRKKLMPAVATVSGAAVRLFDPTTELGIAEGIETAIAAHELFGVPVWAAISAGGVETFVPPETVRKLRIYTDHDLAGIKAAGILAGRLKIEVEIAIPPTPGTDWLDVLTGAP